MKLLHLQSIIWQQNKTTIRFYTFTSKGFRYLLLCLDTCDTFSCYNTDFWVSFTIYSANLCVFNTHHYRFECTLPTYIFSILVWWEYWHKIRGYETIKELEIGDRRSLLFLRWPTFWEHSLEKSFLLKQNLTQWKITGTDGINTGSLDYVPVLKVMFVAFMKVIRSNSNSSNQVFGKILARSMLL